MRSGAGPALLTCRERCTHTNRALQLPRQKWAQRRAPIPRLGSLRASPWGSHWQKACSTGPAAPSPRATKHHGRNVVGKRLQRSC